MENKDYSQPEIDLFYFFRPVTRVLQRIWKAICHYFATLYRNAGLFIGIVAVFTLLGYFSQWVIPHTYRTTATYVTHVLPTGTCEAMIEDLNERYTPIEHQLDIGTQAATTIEKISVTDTATLDARRTYDSVLFYNNGDSSLRSFNVTLRLNNMRYVDSIQDAIRKYLENTPYSQKRIALRKKTLEELGASLDRKLAGIDSMQEIVNGIVPKPTGAMEPLNPVDLYETSIYYHKQRFSVGQELANLGNIEVLKPFARYENFNYPKLKWLLLIGGLAGLLFAFLLTPLFGKKI